MAKMFPFKPMHRVERFDEGSVTFGLEAQAIGSGRAGPAACRQVRVSPAAAPASTCPPLS
jgi:hypothetical protein